MVLCARKKRKEAQDRERRQGRTHDREGMMLPTNNENEFMKYLSNHEGTDPQILNSHLKKRSKKIFGEREVYSSRLSPSVVATMLAQILFFPFQVLLVAIDILVSAASPQYGVRGAPLEWHFVFAPQ